MTEHAESVEAIEACSDSLGDKVYSISTAGSETVSGQSDSAPVEHAEQSEVMKSEPDTISKENPVALESDANIIESQTVAKTEDNDSEERRPESNPTEVIGSPNQPSELSSSENVQESKEEISEKINGFLKGSTQKEELAQFSDDEISIKSDSNTDDSDSDSSSDSSSDSESDSESSSDSESEDSESKNLDTQDNLEEEDEAPSGPIVSKNEVDEKPQELPTDYKVPEDAPLEYIGDITALVERSVIIKASVSGEFRILKEDSILCFEDRQLLGPLYETFGKLQSPIYRVLLSSTEELAKFKDKKGSKVFYVVPDSQFLLTDSIKKIKGTDASNCHDEELPEDEQEFSDDEQELARKQEKSRKKKQKKQDKDGEPPKKKPAKNETFSTYGFAPPKAPTVPQPVTYNPIYQHDAYGTRPGQSVRNPEVAVPAATSLYNETKSNPSSQQYQNVSDYYHTQQNMQTMSYNPPNVGYNPSNMGYNPQYNQPGLYTQYNQYQHPGQLYQQPAPAYIQQGTPYEQRYQPNIMYGTHPSQPQYQPYNQQIQTEYHQYQQFPQNNGNNMQGNPQAGGPPQQVAIETPIQSELKQGTALQANPNQSNAALQQLHEMVSSQLSHKKSEEDTSK